MFITNTNRNASDNLPPPVKSKKRAFIWANVPPPTSCCLQEELTVRNQIDPCARAALLHPDHLYDELGGSMKEWVSGAAAP